MTADKKFLSIFADPGLDGEPVVILKSEEDPEDPEEKPPVAIPKLASHEIDIPEEPEEVEIVQAVWDETSQAWIDLPPQTLLLVPTGCAFPEELNPFDTVVSLRSALPRDKEKDANLYQAYQKNNWVSRDWVREHLDEDIDSAKEDKRIADDIPINLASQGIPETSGVAQTPGLDPGQEAPGDNHGAPNPPKPGPGRGNKFTPGDNLG